MQWVAGVDEAGRGPLAGPVAAAAVVLDPAVCIEGLRDSKALSAMRRAMLFDEIMTRAVAVSVALAPPEEIDALNIRGATLAAMTRAVQGLSVTPALVLIDGRDVPPGLPCQGRAIIGGDRLEPAIQAAAIVAKVTRDRLMVRLGTACPGYGFEVHMGYPTAMHRQALAALGVSPHHRHSYAPVRAAAQRENGRGGALTPAMLPSITAT